MSEAKQSETKLSETKLSASDFAIVTSGIFNKLDLDQSGTLSRDELKFAADDQNQESVYRQAALHLSEHVQDISKLASENNKAEGSPLRLGGYYQSLFGDEKHDADGISSSDLTVLTAMGREQVVDAFVNDYRKNEKTAGGQYAMASMSAGLYTVKGALRSLYEFQKGDTFRAVLDLGYPIASGYAMYQQGKSAYQMYFNSQSDMLRSEFKSREHMIERFY